jgi:hypothetical protein
MKRITLTLAFFLTVTANILAQNNSGGMNMPEEEKKPATLMTGLGSYHHKVSTTNAEAQKFSIRG